MVPNTNNMVGESSNSNSNNTGESSSNSNANDNTAKSSTTNIEKQGTQSPPSSSSLTSSSSSFEIVAPDDCLGVENGLDEEAMDSLINRSLYFLEYGIDSDLTLNVGTKKIKVHKNILKMYSTYFEKNLPNDSALREFEVDGVSYDDLQLFLKYLYSRVTLTKVEDAWPIFICGTKLEVKEYSNTACKLLESALSMPSEETQNSRLCVLIVLEEALKYKRADLQESALKYICKNAFKILECREFTKLSCEALELIIARDDLCAFDEMQVFNAVLRWAIPAEYFEGQDWQGSITDEQKSVLRSYLKYVRFGQMTQMDFKKYCLQLKILEAEYALSILECFDLPVETRSEPKPRDYCTPIGPVNNVKIVISEYDYWIQNSQLKFRIDKAGWLTHIRLAPSYYDNQKFNVKCKFVQLCEDSLRTEVISTVVQPVETICQRCPIIKFEKPLRINSGQWYLITARIDEKASQNARYIYKSEKMPAKLQWEQNGEVMALEINPEFTNNEITEIGIIRQSDLVSTYQFMPSSEVKPKENEAKEQVSPSSASACQLEPCKLPPEEENDLNSEKDQPSKHVRESIC